MLQAICNPTTPGGAGNGASNASSSGIARSVLDNLAARFRPSGLCLLMLNADGTVAFHDSSAGLFIQRQARLLLGMIRDQVRLAGLETELDSLSGQLANTYEELSLIYQLSSGMRINRRAGDFFKQACLDVLEVMGVRGMGVTLLNNLHGCEPVLYGSMSLPPGKVHRLADDLMKVLTGRKSVLLINDLTNDKTFNWLGECAKQL